MMGSMMVPEMTSRGYKQHMSMGPILGTGGLAMIIPPSALAVLLASLAEIDIGKLLIAGVFPGLVLAILYSILIYAQVKIDPDAAPEYSVEKTLDRRNPAVPSLSTYCRWDLSYSVSSDLLSSESQHLRRPPALERLASWSWPYSSRVISWEIIVKSFSGSLRVSAMVLLIILASSTFSQLLAYTGASAGLIEWATGANLSPMVMLLIMFGVLLILGMFMDQVSMMLLTVPIFFPLAPDPSVRPDLVRAGYVAGP